MVIGRRALGLGLASAGLAAWLGCGDRGGPAAAATSDASPARARRIVSVSPSASESIFALGRGAEMVGRSAFCDEPPAVKAVPEVGGFADPSLERIVALAPTLVVGERGPAGPRLVEALEQRGIATYFPPITSIAEIEAFLGGLGERLDAGDAARALVAKIDQGLSDVAARVAGRRRPRVAFLFDFKPLIVAGPGSFPDEVLRRAGCDNVATTGGIYPRLGPEGLVALDPEIVIDGSAPGVYAGEPLAILRGIEGLGSLRAVRDERVGRLPGTSALRPGPRIADGVGEVLRLVEKLGAAR